MRYALLCVLSVLFPVFLPAHSAGGKGFDRIAAHDGIEVLRWTDTCNVYVIRAGRKAVLIDLGDAAVLDRLAAIGVEQVDWVLFTHHHREQCQGAPRLDHTVTRIAVPKNERELFEDPVRFRPVNISLGDRHTVYGASYVRPPARPIVVDTALEDGTIFNWNGIELQCMETKGNSPGAMSYLLAIGDRRLVFTGDVILDGPRMHYWFDTEWDYGYGRGLDALIASIASLRKAAPDMMLPAHGRAIRNPKQQLTTYESRLKRLRELYVRGYELGPQAVADQDNMSKPTAVEDIGRISEHIYKFDRKDFWPNFTIIMADSGRALLIDAGLIGEELLDRTLTQMQKHCGLVAIDAVIVTHMHGDHFLDVPYLRRRWNAEIWTLDRVAPPCETPRRFNYSAMVNAYGRELKSITFDRLFESGETFDWQGYTFTVDWMPGQTEFGCCIHGVIDGKHVAFTGDNIFGNPANPAHTGHEAVVAHNSAVFEEGYIYAGTYLQQLRPDLILGGHSWVMNQPDALIDRFAAWGPRIRDAYQQLSIEPDYRYMFDPYWVRPEPYRLDMQAGQNAMVTLHMRNFLDRSREYRIAANVPDDVVVEPDIITTEVPAGAVERVSLEVHCDVGLLKKGSIIVPLDVTVDGRRCGQLFDFVVCLQ